MTGPLNGLRVLDLTIWMFGPFCTQTLGDFGADVIKIEPPGGEPGRGIGRDHPTWEGTSTRYLSRNRNKRSIVIDLRQAEGRRTLHRLAQQADVLVHNFRPDVPARLGLDYETLGSLNPRLIYVAGSGFGQTGPYATMGGQDRVAQAMSGFVFGNGDPGTKPFSARTSIMDSFGGMVMVQAILLALLHRDRTGIAQRVDLALFDAAVFSNIESITTALNSADPVGQAYDPLMSIYQTADGLLQLVMVFVRSGSPLQLLCDILGIEDLSRQERFATKAAQAANGPELIGLLEAEFRKQSTAFWLERLRAHDIICSPVYDYAQLAADEQIAVNGMLRDMRDAEGRVLRAVAQPIRLSESPAEIRRFPPEIGEHSVEILREAGLSQPEIEELLANGIVQ